MKMRGIFSFAIAVSATCAAFAREKVPTAEPSSWDAMVDEVQKVPASSVELNPVYGVEYAGFSRVEVDEIHAAIRQDNAVAMAEIIVRMASDSNCTARVDALTRIVVLQSDDFVARTIAAVADSDASSTTVDAVIRSVCLQSAKSNNEIIFKIIGYARSRKCMARIANAIIECNTDFSAPAIIPSRTVSDHAMWFDRYGFTPRKQNVGDNHTRT